MIHRVLLTVLLALPALIWADVPISWPLSTVKIGGVTHAYNPLDGTVFYTQYGQGACTDVYSIRRITLTGTDDTNITCGVYAMNSHYGLPRISPDGLWMLALRHDTSLTGTACDTLEETQPGLGQCNDLVIIKLSDLTLTVLVEGTNNPGTAEKFSWPQWSEDQTMIMWTQYNNTFGSIRYATISLSGTPTLGPITSVSPAPADGFYESWGWLDAAKTIILMACGCGVGFSANDLDIATYNTVTGVFTNLTNTLNILEEHATRFGVDTILYTSNRLSSGAGSCFFCWELYTMRFDGSQKQRVTFFNDPLHPQYVPPALAPLGYFTVAQPERVTPTSFLMHGTTNWAYPSTSSVFLMKLGSIPVNRSYGYPPYGVSVNGR